MVKQAKSRIVWPKEHKLLSLLILVVLGVVSFFVYQRVALELNKRDFQQARAAIDKVYADIVTQVGRPDNSKRVNDCSRPDQEFGQGPLSCSVGIDFIYGVNNELDADTLFKKIQAVIGSHGDLKPTKALDDSIHDTLVVNSYYHSAQDFYSVSDINCSVKYTYDTPRETFLSINSNLKTFYVSLGCDGAARASYYGS